MSDAPDDLAARAAAASALLEEIAEDHRALAKLGEDLRLRLVTAAGRVSRPDRYQRKALGKALLRARVAEKRQRDRDTLDQTGIRVLRKQPVFRAPLPMPATDLDDADDGGWGEAEAEHEEAPRRVIDPRTCYVCKTSFHDLHHFYDQMCAECAELNWAKRNQSVDLSGRTVLVTGAHLIVEVVQVVERRLADVRVRGSMTRLGASSCSASASPQRPAIPWASSSAR